MDKKREKEKINFIYRFIRGAAGLLARLCFKINIVGRENIPNTGGFIAAGNHRSMWDVVVLAIAMKYRQLRFLGKEELFKFPPLGYIFKKLGVVPVSRGQGDFAALDVSADVIRNGHVINIFPEGTRSFDGIPLKPKSGIGLVVHKAKSDVLPFSIYMEGNFRTFKKITIRFGKLVKYDSFNLQEKLSSRERKRVTADIMDYILQLLEKGHSK